MIIKYSGSITCAVLLLTLITTAVYPQAGALAAMQKIANAYNASTAIHFTGVMKMYDKKVPAKVIDKMTSTYTVQNGNLRCSIGAVSVLINGRYYVSADNNDKLLIIGRKKDLQAAAGAPMLNLTQLTNRIAAHKIKAVLFIRGSDSLVQLADADGKSGFSTCNIAFSPATGYMKKVVLEITNYNNEIEKTMVLETIYTEPVPELPRGDLFSEHSFFSLIDNKIQLAAGYKNYRVINQL